MCVEKKKRFNPCAIALDDVDIEVPDFGDGYLCVRGNFMDMVVEVYIDEPYETLEEFLNSCDYSSMVQDALAQINSNCVAIAELLTKRTQGE